MPARSVLILLLPFVFCSTDTKQCSRAGSLPPQNNTLFEHVRDIPLPRDYKRLEKPTASFASWLRALPLKRDKTVYLYNGSKKVNQSAQFAVLDVPVGNKDLQQCADAVMRLRAGFLLSAGRVAEICFADNAGRRYQCPKDPAPPKFEAYLETVYRFCGTTSLSRQLRPVKDARSIQAGDVLIKGGSPGHAVIVIDVAEKDNGEKIFMLAQSYMPAQSVHILNNPMDHSLHPGTS